MKLTTQSSASLYSFLPLISNILLTTLLSQTHNLCSSLDTRNQISHPHKMTRTVSLLQMSKCNILNWMEATMACTYPAFLPTSWSFSHFVRIKHTFNQNYNKVTTELHKQC